MRLTESKALPTGPSVGSGSAARPGRNETGNGVQVVFLGDATSIQTRSPRPLVFWLLCACLIQVRLHLWH